MGAISRSLLVKNKMLDMLLPMLGIDKKALPTEAQLSELIAELRTIPVRVAAMEATLERIETHLLKDAENA